MRDDFDGGGGREGGKCVSGVIVPLAAYCEAIRGCVAALVILPEVGRCWQRCAGGGWLATVRPAQTQRVASGAFFRDERDPEPRSRNVFAFHHPETLAALLQDSQTLRTRLAKMPTAHPLSTTSMRACQVDAITNLEKSFANADPRALIQMATGAGKTYTACAFTYACGQSSRQSGKRLDHRFDAGVESAAMKVWSAWLVSTVAVPFCAFICHTIANESSQYS